MSSGGILQQVAAEMKTLTEVVTELDRNNRIRLESRFEGVRVYLNHAMGDFQHNLTYAVDGIATHERPLHDMIETMHGMNYRSLDALHARAYAIYRGVRRIVIGNDLPTSSMGSEARASILRRRFHRYNLAGTPTSSPDEDEYSENEPIDDYQNELLMSDVLRASNPDMDDDAMMQHLIAGRDEAVSEGDDERARSLQRLISLIHFEKPPESPGQVD